MGRTVAGQALAWAIGLAPVVLALVTWTPHGPEPWMLPLRSFAVPVLIMEIVTILVALATDLVGTLQRMRLPRPAAIAAVVLALVMVGTIPFAPVSDVAMTRTSSWLIHIFFGLSVAHLAGRWFTPGDLVRSYAIGFVLFCGVFFLLLIQVRDPIFNWSRDLPAFVHVRIIGHYAAPMAALAAAMMALSRTAAGWAAGFAVSTSAFGLILWTGSRAALIGAAAALLAGLLFAPLMRKPRAWAGFAASLAVALLLVSSLPAPSKEMGSARIVTSTVQSQDKTTGRIGMWANVAKVTAKRPIFGYGEGQMYYVARSADILHPHNIVLQVLLAWGVVGCACVLILGFYFARGSIRLVRSTAGDLLPPFIAMAALAVPSLVDGSLFHLLPVSIFAACAGMVGSRMLQAEPRTQPC